MIKQDIHVIKGMQKDISVSKFNSEFVFDAQNIRITAKEDTTLMSVTNEKGTKEISIGTIKGTIIGYNTLNEYLVLFTTGDKDRIYRITFNNTISNKVLYEGNLNFSTENPIESICVYENKDIQKIYWTDGLNQPRVLNIVSSDKIISKWNDNSFNFVQELTLNEKVTVERNDLSNGLFSPGIIQYAFTYYNKYGQESNIFYTTPLNYISFSDRGGSPEDKVSNSFTITVDNVDTRFEYLRIYSIHRTSIDAVPTVLKVIDLPVSNKIIYIDNGTIGETVDPTELLYVGGESIVAKTMTQKDNTLFLGNLEIDRPSINTEVKELLLLDSPNESELLKTTLREIRGNVIYNDSYYKYVNELNLGNSAGFKSSEHYRLGLQFQYKTGKWSEPVFIGDYIIDENVRPDLAIIDDNYTLSIPQIEYSLDSYISKKVKDLGYKRVRPVVVFPSLQDKRIITQGMLCPTVFNIESRNNNTPFSQSSWFLRPFLPWHVDMSNDKMDNNKNIDKGAWVEFRHHYGIFNGPNRGAEIQNISQKTTGEYNLSEVNDPDTYPSLFMVDQSILTLHSPDIEFDTSIQTLDYSKLQLRIVGAINFTSSIGDIDIQTSSPVVHPTKATGYVHKTLGSQETSDLAARSLVSGLFYYDWLIDDKKNENYNYYSDEKEEVGWLIYPWQKSGSINNDINVNNRAKSSVLSKKKMSNLKFSSFNTWFASRNYWYSKKNDTIHNGITNVQLFNSNEVSLIKLTTPENSTLKNVNYYGNIDSLLPAKQSYSLYFTGASKTLNGSTETWVNPTFFDTQFNTISDDVKALGDYNDNLKYSKDPVRMKYKSSPHFVFGLNYSSGSSSQVILPTTYGAVGEGVNRISDSTKPYWLGKTTSIPTTLFVTLKWVWRENYDPGLTYPQLEWEFGDYYYDGYNNILYKYNASTVEDFPFDVVSIEADGLYLNDFRFEDEENITTYYYRAVYQVDKYILSEYTQSSGGDFEFSVKQDIITERVMYPYLFLAELYREDKDIENPFGGKSEDALKSNSWVPAGEAITLEDNGNLIEFKYGDTWYQRYDCLKTYPFTLEDENSIVEIGSFMCETRVNINGRYDRNRGQISNILMSPTNFNKYNEVYTQKDNFFKYRILDDDFYKLNKFNNTITWTKEKSSGEDIDTWTNITMASTLDLDGDKGKIVSLNTLNNEIFCFQNKGFSNILFNSRVQIPTSDDVPIEITNGLKVQGKRYISNTLGCNNKWSIVTTPSGLYFIDNTTDGIYLFNGQQVVSLSDNLSMGNWVGENNSFDDWNPVNFNNFVSYYDSNGGDVYFVNKNTALVYSELLGQFTSFMNYENVPAMFNVNNKFYSFKNNKLWEHFAGDYNMFYGEFKPYSFTVISNADSPYDKIFNNIEYRADSWYKDNVLAYNNTFDTLEVWNEYQKGICDLTYLKSKPSPLKKKFRVWRANIPRFNVDWNGVKANKLDRIRNTWAYIKLSRNKENTDKMVFHDLMVNYFL